MKEKACVTNNETPMGYINAYYDGLREGVWRFAYLKDGVYYVGTTGKTLKEAQAEIEADRKRDLSEAQL